MSEKASFYSRPILVTGAAGNLGSVGQTLTKVLLQQGQTVRAMVHREDARAQSLRDLGAEVVCGDLTSLDDMNRIIKGCGAIFFSMSVSPSYLNATTNVAAVAKHLGVDALINVSQMTVAQMSSTTTTDSPQQKLHWLSEQVLNWSGLPVIHLRPTVFMDGFFFKFSAEDIKCHDELRLPFANGMTSPIAASDVALAAAAILRDPQAHVERIYQLTGPHLGDLAFYADEYSKVLGRKITYRDMDLDTWRQSMASKGIDAHTLNHLTTMVRLHRVGRYARMTDDFRKLTGHEPTSFQDFVRFHQTWL
jgi:uncharacterized protein YbjT (DUF2867 family)